MDIGNAISFSFLQERVVLVEVNDLLVPVILFYLGKHQLMVHRACDCLNTPMVFYYFLMITFRTLNFSEDECKCVKYGLKNQYAESLRTF